MSDFGATGIRWAGSGYGMVEFGRDDQMMVLFYTRAVKNDVKSRDANRPIHEDMTYVKIFTPGERLNQIDRPVKEDDKQRWPRQWADFVHKRTQVPDGTPIELLFPNHPSIPENMKSMGIFTIEQCANLSAHAIDSVGMGGQEYVNKAKGYLKSAEKGLGFNKLQSEMEDLKQQLRISQKQLVDQKKQLDEAMARLLNPSLHSQSPPFVPGFDAQSERINANHKTQEIKAQQKSAMAAKRQRNLTEDESPLGDIED